MNGQFGHYEGRTAIEPGVLATHSGNIDLLLMHPNIGIRTDDPTHDIAVQYATVHIYAVGPSAPYRHSPDDRRSKRNLRLLEVLRKPGPPPTRSRTVLGRAEVNPNVEMAEFSVIKTQVSRGF
jgi:hypothetical protein